MQFNSFISAKDSTLNFILQTAKIVQAHRILFFHMYHHADAEVCTCILVN
jgi:hypothetical protein